LPIAVFDEQYRSRPMLDFIEYFTWGVSEQGYPFKAFSKKEILE